MTDLLALLAHVQTAGDGWTARCPAHDDRRNSLSVGRGDDDRWLLKCHAGCSIDAILIALSLEKADLFPAPAQSHMIGAVYPYADEHGQLLYEVVRLVPKDFRQRAADGTWSVKGLRKVLYRLPELRDRRTVFIVEGEADANRLWGLHVPATTNAGGAGKWRDEYAQQLTAAGVQNIVVVPDNDPPGHAHGVQVARSCHDAGLIVKVITLPGLATKGDVSDFLATHTRAELLAIVQSAGRFTATTGAAQVFALMSVADLLAEPDERFDWVIDNRIARAGSNLFVSPPKVGKTTICTELAVQVARGRPFLGWPTTQGVVWFLALQESKALIKKRLRALGATSSDPIRWFIGQAPTTLISELEVRAGDERPVLIIVDMLANILRVKDFNDYGAVTSGFDPLLQVSRATAAALLLLHHGSAHQYREGIDAVLGSTALSGCVDNLLILKRDGAVRSLSTIQRIGDDLESTVLEFDKASGRSTLGQSKAAFDELEMQRKMLALMQASPTPLPESLLQANLDGRRKDMVKVLRYLVGTRQVARSGGGKRGDPYVYRVVGNTGSQSLFEGADSGSQSSIVREPELSTNSGQIFAKGAGEIAGSRPIEKKREPETLDLDLSQDLDLFPDSRRAESFLVPSDPDTRENDPSELAISPDKHWSDAGSQRSESSAESVTDTDQGLSRRRQAEGDERFKRGWK